MSFTRTQTWMVVGLALGVMVFAAACGGEDEVRDYATILQEAKVCADGSTTHGMDVSYWQSTINWDKVASSSIKFAFIRTSDGFYKDPQFSRNWSEAKRVGVVRGAYHFFRPSKDAAAQADVMMDMMGALGDGDLPAVIDIEDESLYSGYSRATIIQKLHTFLDRVEQKSGKVPMIYCGYYFWNDIVNSSEFSRNPLWIAQWGPTCPTIPNAWSRWTFFQTSDKGIVPGVPGNSADLDLFNGSLSELEAFAGGGGNSGGGGNGGGGNTADATLEGVVFVDKGLGTSDMSMRLPGAHVSLSGSESTTARADDAFWSFSVSAGSYTVTASMSGYKTASRTCGVTSGAAEWCSVGLEKDDSSGGSSGGGSGGSGSGGGGSSGGGNNSGGNTGGGGQDTGTFFGYVMVPDDGWDAHTPLTAGTPVGGATVSTGTGLTATTDESGYYELVVPAGKYGLGSSKDNYYSGTMLCTAVANDRTQCNIPIKPKEDSSNDQGGTSADTNGNQPDDVGCSTAGSHGALWLGLALLGMLIVRRRAS